MVIVPDTSKTTKEGLSMFDVEKYGDDLDTVFILPRRINLSEKWDAHGKYDSTKQNERVSNRKGEILLIDTELKIYFTHKTIKIGEYCVV